MRIPASRPMRHATSLFLLAAVAVIGLAAQQLADPNFDTRVGRPAYEKGNGPLVLIDEAHNNFHTLSGRYKPLADLLANDGYRLAPNATKFSAEALAGAAVLVIANAAGAPGNPDCEQPVFAADELDALAEWVRQGGSLLLVADHAPYGSCAAPLAERFGATMYKGTTADPFHHDTESGNASFLVFSRDAGLLGDHPILNGRDKTERVQRVMSFTGQSLQGPAGSVSLLKLSDTAFDRPARTAADRQAARDQARAGGGIGIQRQQINLSDLPSAAGRSQAVAFVAGKGRVVVLGEAAMLSAQIVTGPAAQVFGKEVVPIGMNAPGNEDKQFALNVLHWLSGLLPAAQ